MKPEDWKKKHKEERKRDAKSARPDVGSYNPHPVEFKTFAKDLELAKEKKGKSSSKAWGSDERFGVKKDGKKDPNNFPGPGTYGMMATWNGKLPNGKADKVDKNWMNKITKGIERSIYY